MNIKVFPLLFWGKKLLVNKSKGPGGEDFYSLLVCDVFDNETPIDAVKREVKAILNFESNDVVFAFEIEREDGLELYYFVRDYEGQCQNTVANYEFACEDSLALNFEYRRIKKYLINFY